jgi:hypothetical protein
VSRVILIKRIIEGISEGNKGSSEECPKEERERNRCIVRETSIAECRS